MYLTFEHLLVSLRSTSEPASAQNSEWAFATLKEEWPRLEPERIDLSRLETDVGVFLFRFFLGFPTNPPMLMLLLLLMAPGAQWPTKSNPHAHKSASRSEQMVAPGALGGAESTAGSGC